MAQVRVTVLGSGGSAGVPLIGCQCAVCTSTNTKNKRTRASILVEAGGRNILIDTSPDLRFQALANGINRVDAVLFTHEHADHVHGIDDMRSFNFLADEAIPAYLDPDTLALLQQRFGYVFMPKPENLWFRPCLIPNLIEMPLKPFDVLGVEVVPFEQRHGKYRTLGFRIGDFAYSTDCDAIPDESFETLKGVKLWLVDCLRYSASYSHANLELTLGWIARVKPERAVLTHMAHDFDYDNLLNSLPQGIMPAYDGLRLECP